MLLDYLGVVLLGSREKFGGIGIGIGIAVLGIWLLEEMRVEDLGCDV